MHGDSIVGKYNLQNIVLSKTRLLGLPNCLSTSIATKNHACQQATSAKGIFGQTVSSEQKLAEMWELDLELSSYLLTKKKWDLILTRYIEKKQAHWSHGL